MTLMVAGKALVSVERAGSETGSSFQVNPPAFAAARLDELLEARDIRVRGKPAAAVAPRNSELLLIYWTCPWTICAWPSWRTVFLDTVPCTRRLWAALQFDLTLTSSTLQ